MYLLSRRCHTQFPMVAKLPTSAVLALVSIAKKKNYAESCVAVLDVFSHLQLGKERLRNKIHTSLFKPHDRQHFHLSVAATKLSPGLLVVVTVDAAHP